MPAAATTFLRPGLPTRHLTTIVYHMGKEKYTFFLLKNMQEIFLRIFLEKRLRGRVEFVIIPFKVGVLWDAIPFLRRRRI